MQTEISNIVVVIIMGVLTLAAIGIGIYARRLAQVIREFVETKLDELPLDLRERLDEAVAIATEFVEFLDREGRLSEFIRVEILDKSKAKLDLAVRLTVERVELFIEAETGLVVDIPEEQIIMLIERYILDNPEIFEEPKDPVDAG